VSEGRELRRAAVRAAREARGRLARAMAPLQDDGSTAPEIAERLEASVSSIVGRLFAAETASTPESVLDAVVDAMDQLRGLLVELHGVAPQDATVQGTTEAVAQTLALLYPAKQELLRAQRPEDVEPLPLTRRRSDPPGGKPRERRITKRVHIEADIGFQSETNFYTGFSGNISNGGIFVATWDLLDIGTELTISFVLPDGHQVTTRGRVTWVREAPEHDSELTPGMGVEFEDLAQGGRRAVQAFIDHRAPLFFDG